MRASVAASTLLSQFWTAGRDSRVPTRPCGVLFSATTASIISAREGCDRSGGLE
jgi:hypothetical protein